LSLLICVKFYFLFNLLVNFSAPFSFKFPHMNNIDNLTFASINCNSLNMSSSSKLLQHAKLYGAAKLKTDVIFLSDIRLSNRNLVSNFNNIATIFRVNPYASYRFLHNSTQNKRGTGILIKHDIPFTERARRSDPDENYILLMAEIKGNNLILGSIYGPNNHDNEFFTSLQRDIASLGDFFTVLGGDWNCTLSCNNIDNNIDCINMATPPNLRHSNYVSTLCENLNLMDPFRALHPLRRDFSYVPRAVGQLNRSRIDFFLVSRDLIPSVTECEICPHLQSKLFDHKAITLSFIPLRFPKNNRVSISNSILYEDDIDIVVRNSVLECYLLHINDNNLINFNREQYLNYVGRIWTLLRDAGSPHLIQVEDEGGYERFIHREACLDEIRILFNLLDLDYLQTLPLTP